MSICYGRTDYAHRPWELQRLRERGIKPISLADTQLEAGAVSPRHSVGDIQGDVCVSAHHGPDCAPARPAAEGCCSRGVIANTGRCE